MDKIMGFLLPAHPTATPPGEVGVKVPKPPPPQATCSNILLSPDSAAENSQIHCWVWALAPGLTLTSGQRLRDS